MSMLWQERSWLFKLLNLQWHESFLGYFSHSGHHGGLLVPSCVCSGNVCSSFLVLIKLLSGHVDDFAITLTLQNESHLEVFFAEALWLDRCLTRLVLTLACAAEHSWGPLCVRHLYTCLLGDSPLTLHCVLCDSQHGDTLCQVALVRKI